MSEYQYYEFQAIDEPLTADEQVEVDSWSSRAHTTPTRAVFTYNYGDFPKSPQEVVEKYFDAMLYLTNWGTRQLMFRYPKTTVNKEMIKLYCHPDRVSLIEKKDCLILDVYSFPENGGDWVEGEGWLSSLIPLRNNIINGDYRMLYLAWLQGIIVEYDLDQYKNNLEPPVPDNLRTLTGALKCFIEFFEIDNDLISIASENSNTVPEISKSDIEKAVLKLTEDERLAYLTDFMVGKKQVKSQLTKRLKELLILSDKSNPEPKRRRISDLLSQLNLA